ncbi:MAG: AmpG family muropeptide MFS transporter [Pseudomonadota bacterium]|jgi:PAT family beta-lactamase induction signal transducer AmpG
MTSTGDSAPAAARTGWRGWVDAARVYGEPAVARMLLLGFSAGLPLLLVFGTLSFWLREAGVDRTTIGFLSWVAMAYAFKWVWAPLVDRLPLPLLTRALGRRRAWLLLSQLAIIAALCAMATCDPQVSLRPLVLAAVALAFASATQDIALDAYRIESAGVERQAAMAAAYQTGYRLAMIWSGAGVLWIAARFDPSEATYEQAPWMVAYLAMAASMLVGVLTVLLSPEPAARTQEDARAEERALAERLARRLPAPLARLGAWIHHAAVNPFAEFVRRYRWHALLVLALIAVYRVSDVVMGVMANPFYRDLGYTKDEVAAVSKVYGLVMTLVGVGLGGILSMRLGVMRVLFLGALLSALTNLLFSWLAGHGHDVGALILVVAADNLSAGIASSAFIAYLSGLTHVSYSATQYALFTSVMLLLPKFLAGFSGWVVDQVGYGWFFAGTALLGLPVLALVWLAGRVRPVGGSTTRPAPGEVSPGGTG